MPIAQAMPKAMAPNAARAARADEVHQPRRDPRPVLDKNDPRRETRRTRQSRPAVTASPSPAPRPAIRPSGSGFSVEKALVWVGYFVAFVLVVLFGVDLACAWPLGRYAPFAEAVFAACGAILGYLSWDTYRELR